MDKLDSSLERAAEFMWRNARLLDRAMFAREFLGGPPGAVITALMAYRNTDGGFGNALEPDVRAPGSMPLHCEQALYVLPEAEIRAAGLAMGVCRSQNQMGGSKSSRKSSRSILARRIGRVRLVRIHPIRPRGWWGCCTFRPSSIDGLRTRPGGASRDSSERWKKPTKPSARCGSSNTQTTESARRKPR